MPLKFCMVSNSKKYLRFLPDCKDVDVLHFRSSFIIYLLSLTVAPPLGHMALRIGDTGNLVIITSVLCLGWKLIK